MTCEHGGGCPDCTQQTPHEPLEVTSVDGWTMVKCSCDGGNPRRVRWQAAYWLRHHWQGTEGEGCAALNAVIVKQAGGES